MVYGVLIAKRLREDVPQRVWSKEQKAYLLYVKLVVTELVQKNCVSKQGSFEPGMQHFPELESSPCIQ